MNAFGATNTDMVRNLANLGITLLLFTVGLKLNLRTLARPQVWALTTVHGAIVVSVFGLAIYGLALAGVGLFADLSIQTAMLIAFALSFSSTVFVVKVLEEKGEMASLHGRIAIGILIMQDIAAVLFLAFSAGEIPSWWALLLLLLVPARPLLHLVLQRAGHGELLVLYGFLLALGGSQIFALVEMKGDLGALIIGVLIANHPKAEEMAKNMLGFKDLFLLGFFLSIGLSAQLTLETVVVGAVIALVVVLKTALFFALFVAFKLRARTSLLASVNLSNYSEFGLIVASIGVANGWLPAQWLVVIAVAVALSFVLAAVFSANTHELYIRQRKFWAGLQRSERIADDRLLDLGEAKIAVIGVGGIGTGAYDELRERYGETVVGVDLDPVTVRNQQASGRHVILGDPSDTDFWDRVQAAHTLEQVMLALPKLSSNLEVIERLNEVAYTGQIAATAKFPDEEQALRAAGATTVFNVYAEAGVGYAAHVAEQRTAAN